MRVREIVIPWWLAPACNGPLTIAVDRPIVSDVECETEGEPRGQHDRWRLDGNSVYVVYPDVCVIFDVIPPYALHGKGGGEWTALRVAKWDDNHATRFVKPNVAEVEPTVVHAIKKGADQSL
jgi:hypothetical protein